MIGARFYAQLEAAQMRNDLLENELAKVRLQRFFVNDLRCRNWKTVDYSGFCASWEQSTNVLITIYRPIGVKRVIDICWNYSAITYSIRYRKKESRGWIWPILFSAWISWIRVFLNEYNWFPVTVKMSFWPLTRIYEDALIRLFGNCWSLPMPDRQWCRRLTDDHKTPETARSLEYRRGATYHVAILFYRLDFKLLLVRRPQERQILSWLSLLALSVQFFVYLSP